MLDYIVIGVSCSLLHFMVKPLCSKSFDQRYITIEDFFSNFTFTFEKPSFFAYVNQLLIENQDLNFLSVFFHIMRNNGGKPRFIFWYPFFTFATLFMYEKTIFWGVTRLILQKYYNYNTQKRGNTKSEILKSYQILMW